MPAPSVTAMWVSAHGPESCVALKGRRSLELNAAESPVFVAAMARSDTECPSPVTLLTGPQRDRFASRSMKRYRVSTFARAHGVLRKTFRLDAMLGSWLKQRSAMRSPNPGQPYVATSLVSITSSVTPCKGLRGCWSGVVMA